MDWNNLHHFSEKSTELISSSDTLDLLWMLFTISVSSSYRIWTEIWAVNLLQLCCFRPKFKRLNNYPACYKALGGISIIARFKWCGFFLCLFVYLFGWGGACDSCGVFFYSLAFDTFHSILNFFQNFITI